MQAIRATRPGGHVGLSASCMACNWMGTSCFGPMCTCMAGLPPVRRFLPELVDLIWNRQIDPVKVFDLELPLVQAAEGYRAMDRREAIKVLLRP
jgi:threonine dehydrogenase-like Zn-dependent dehydrogenase